MTTTSAQSWMLCRAAGAWLARQTLRTFASADSLRTKVRSACTFGPLMAFALRTIGLLLILLGLLVPGLASALEPKLDVQVSPPPKLLALDDEGGACGEDEEFEELIDCGSDIDGHFAEPLAIALLRTTEVLVTARQCEELLADIWSRQSCSASGRECGKLLAGGVHPSGLELLSSSASGHVSVAALGLGASSLRRLGRPLDERMPKLADLMPPVPPPKLVVL